MSSVRPNFGPGRLSADTFPSIGHLAETGYFGQKCVSAEICPLPYSNKLVVKIFYPKPDTETDSDTETEVCPQVGCTAGREDVFHVDEAVISRKTGE